MFDWGAANSNSSGNHVVSSDFWIYWVYHCAAYSLVAAGWRFWWTWEKRSFDADILQEIENIERPSGPIQLPYSYKGRPALTPPAKRSGGAYIVQCYEAIWNGLFCL